MSEKKPFDGPGLTVGEALQKFKNLIKSPKFDAAKEAFSLGSSLVRFVQDEGDTLAATSVLLDLIKISSNMVLTSTSVESKASANHVFERLSIEAPYVLLENFLTSKILPHLDMSKCLLVERQDPEDKNSATLWRYEVTPGYFLYWCEEGEDHTGLCCNLDDLEYIKHDAFELFKSLLWKTHSSFVELVFDSEDGDLYLQDKESLAWDYEGEQGKKLVQRWSKFRKGGFNRSVILHGVPGTGKSTLAQMAMRQLGERSCFVSVQALSGVPVSTFFSIIYILAPEVLIVDDLDRLDTDDLSLLLSYFENLDIPLFIATTNHLDSLPDALKRPGRFDEIWEIKPPTKEVRRKLVAYLAEVDGFQLTEQAAQDIEDFAEGRELSGAYLREVIRRYKILGPESLEEDDTDLTFSVDWRSSDVYDSPVRMSSDWLEDFDYV